MSKILKLCLTLLTLSQLCFGAKLLNHSVYDRDERFDLLLTFDEPYNGHVSQSKQGDFAVVTLNDLTANKSESKEIQNKLVQKFLISPESKRTNIAFTLDEKAVINISLVNDKMGLRIRILANGTNVNPTNLTPSVLNSGTTNSLNQANLANQATLPNPTNLELQTKSSSLESFDFTNYIFVLCILFVVLIALWWLKRKVLKAHHFDSKDFRLIFQRPLDKHNQFMILEFENIRYVMIIGSSNLILQRSEVRENTTPQEKKEKRQTQEFDSFFEENKQKLQRLVQKNQN